MNGWVSERGVNRHRHTRERETDRQTHTHTDRQTHTQTHRHTHTQTHTHRHTQTHTDTHTHTHTGSSMTASQPLRHASNASALQGSSSSSVVMKCSEMPVSVEKVLSSAFCSSSVSPAMASTPKVRTAHDSIVLAPNTYMPAKHSKTKVRGKEGAREWGLRVRDKGERGGVEEDRTSGHRGWVAHTHADTRKDTHTYIHTHTHTPVTSPGFCCAIVSMSATMEARCRMNDPKYSSSPTRSWNDVVDTDASWTRHCWATCSNAKSLLTRACSCQANAVVESVEGQLGVVKCFMTVGVEGV